MERETVPEYVCAHNTQAGVYWGGHCLGSVTPNNCGTEQGSSRATLENFQDSLHQNSPVPYENVYFSAQSCHITADELHMDLLVS